jgi:aromatic-L-amino-acid decarboxylase
MSAGSPWLCDLGLDLSRGFRALKTWARLKVYGTDTLGATISRTCDLARYLEGRMIAAPELELMAPVELNIVCFRYRFGPADDAVADEVCNELNRTIVVELQEAGVVVPSITVIDGKIVIRARKLRPTFFECWCWSRRTSET